MCVRTDECVWVPGSGSLDPAHATYRGAAPLSEPGLPSIEHLKDVRLQVPLRVYSRDDKFIAEFGEKRRIPLTFEDVVPIPTNNGGSVTFEGAYVVGAEGARSNMRKRAGIGYLGFTYDEKFLVVSTPFPFEEVFDDFSFVNYVADPEEWCVVLRTDKVASTPSNCMYCALLVCRVTVSWACDRGAMARRRQATPASNQVGAERRLGPPV